MENDQRVASPYRTLKNVSTVMHSGAWGSSALTYETTVRANHTSNAVLRTADAVSVAQGIRDINQ